MTSHFMTIQHYDRPMKSYLQPVLKLLLLCRTMWLCEQNSSRLTLMINCRVTQPDTPTHPFCLADPCRPRACFPAPWVLCPSSPPPHRLLPYLHLSSCWERRARCSGPQHPVPEVGSIFRVSQRIVAI